MSRSIRQQLKHKADSAKRDATYRKVMALAEKDIANRRIKDQWAKEAQRKTDAAQRRYEREK